MRHIVFIVLIALLSTSVGMAHMIKGDRNEVGHDYPDNRMEGYGFLGWGMHGSGGPGYGAGRGMPGYGGYGMIGRHGMMGYGGPGMMEYGMGPGMWGYDAKTYDKFLNDTVEMRKDFHIRQFDYSEALRNRDVKRDDLIKMEKEMLELQMKIQEKWWNRTD